MRHLFRPARQVGQLSATRSNARRREGECPCRCPAVRAEVCRIVWLLPHCAGRQLLLAPGCSPAAGCATPAQLSSCRRAHVDERVHDGHGLGGDTGVGVHLLEHLVDVDLVGLSLGTGRRAGRWQRGSGARRGSTRAAVATAAPPRAGPAAAAAPLRRSQAAAAGRVLQPSAAAAPGGLPQAAHPNSPVVSPQQAPGTLEICLRAARLRFSATFLAVSAGGEGGGASGAGALPTIKRELGRPAGRAALPRRCSRRGSGGQGVPARRAAPASPAATLTLGRRLLGSLGRRHCSC